MMWKIGEKWRCGDGKEKKEKSSGSRWGVKMKSLTPLRYTPHPHIHHTSQQSEPAPAQEQKTSDTYLQKVQKTAKGRKREKQPTGKTKRTGRQENHTARGGKKITPKGKRKKGGKPPKRLKIHRHRPEQYPKSRRQITWTKEREKHHTHQKKRGVPPRKIFAPKRNTSD